MTVSSAANPLRRKMTMRKMTMRKKRLSISSDTKRAALHFPVGVFTAWLGTFTPVVCAVFGLGFLVYEVSEDWRIKDRSYKDIFGFLAGIAAGVVLFYLLGWD